MEALAGHGDMMDRKRFELEDTGRTEGNSGPDFNESGETSNDQPITDVKEAGERRTAADEGKFSGRAPTTPPPRYQSEFASSFEGDGGAVYGQRLAEALEAESYQPVILFGNASSGKTSLLLSLFASIKVQPELKSGLHLAPPAVYRDDSEYSRYSLNRAERFLGLMTQQFINGEAPLKTPAEEPFFIPVSLEPVGRSPVRFVFLESAGEWYRPDYKDHRLFPRLRGQIERFISSYQKGIIFLHLVPYTQLPVRTADYDQISDHKKMQDASLAIAGALQNYMSARLNQYQDRHLMLVTKWDARSRFFEDQFDALTEARDELEEFTNAKYPQAYAAYQGLGESVVSRHLNSYCSGIMSDTGVLNLRPDNELRPIVLGYPRNLWTWLYRSALENEGFAAEDPFPNQNSSNPFKRWLSKIVDWVS